MRIIDESESGGSGVDSNVGTSRAADSGVGNRDRKARNNNQRKEGGRT